MAAGKYPENTKRNLVFHFVKVLDFVPFIMPFLPSDSTRLKSETQISVKKKSEQCVLASLSVRLISGF